MKANRFVVIGVILSVVMSGVALALQVKRQPSGWFQKFAIPHQLNELEWRTVQYQLAAIRDSIPSNRGLYVPRIQKYSDDFSTVKIWILVDENNLPSNFEERKSRLNSTAVAASTPMEAYFEGISASNIEVDFVDINKFGAASPNQREAGIVATYKQGNLTIR